MIFLFSFFFLLHDKKATKLVVLRRNLKVFVVLPLRLFVYIRSHPKEREEEMRYERREKISKRSRLHLVQTQ